MPTQNNDERHIIAAWRAAPRRTRGVPTGKASTTKRTEVKRAESSRTREKTAVTDWSKLRRRSDATIRRGIASDPDAHPTDAAFWKDATIVMPTPKTIVTIRLNADLLRWLRQQRGYQTRINAILRAQMNGPSKKLRLGQASSDVGRDAVLDGGRTY